MQDIDYKNWAGQCRALTMRGPTLGILARLCCLGVLVLCAITLASGSAHAADDIVVPRDFPTIQAAVDAAVPGSTIKVRRGTYTEEIVIAKDLTLKGAGAGTTIIEAPPTLTPYALDLRNGNPVVSIVRITDGAQVSLSRFTLAGPIPCSVTGAGIRVVKAARLELAHSRVTRIRPEEDCFSIGQGVVIGLPPFIEMDGQSGSTGHGTITRVNVNRYQANGVIVVSPLSTATISHNVITGGDAIAGVDMVQGGIQVASGAVAWVTDNAVLGNVCTPSFCGPDPINEAQSAGIIALFAAPGTEISENRVSDNDIGIYQLASPHCCTLSENRVRNNRFFGIVIQDGDGTTSENTISGGEVGIGVIAGGENTVGVLRRDEIRRASEEPIREIECCGFEATAIVEDD